MAFLDMWSEVLGQIPSISPFLAQTFVKRAWQDILKMRVWSFNVKEGVLQTPNVISAGTVTTTQFSTTVTPSAAAITALNAAGLNPPIGKYQFGMSAGTPIYNITSYDGATITLDRAYTEVGGSGLSYRIFRCYYDPPPESFAAGATIADFLRFISVRDIQLARTLRLDTTKEELDHRDPQRTNTGDPYVVSTYKYDTTGNPNFELWPHPTAQKAYQCMYQARGSALAVDGDTIPALIPESIVIDKAMAYAYEWANSNQGRYQELRGVDWASLRRDRLSQFMTMLSDTIRQDDEIFSNSIVFKGSPSGYPFPLDSNWLQAHDAGAWFE